MIPTNNSNKAPLSILDGIGDEIDHDLFESVFIYKDLVREAIVQKEAQFNTFRLGFEVQNVHTLIQQITYVHIVIV